MRLGRVPKVIGFSGGKVFPFLNRWCFSLRPLMSPALLPLLISSPKITERLFQKACIPAIPTHGWKDVRRLKSGFSVLTASPTVKSLIGDLIFTVVERKKKEEEVKFGIFTVFCHCGGRRL